MTERENMQLVWDHTQPEWVPMINTASQMLITPEINDRPLFQAGPDWFGLEWVIDPAHPELMSFIKPGQPQFDDITTWREHIVFPSCRDLDWDMIAGRTRAMWKKPEETMGYTVGNMGAFERLNSTMGYENGLVAMYDDPEAYAEYVEAYADYRIEQFEYIKKYMNADFVMMHDDWGTQRNLLISPETWTELFQPLYQDYIDIAKKHGKKMFMHSVLQ